MNLAEAIGDLVTLDAMGVKTTTLKPPPYTQGSNDVAEVSNDILGNRIRAAVLRQVMMQTGEVVIPWNCLSSFTRTRPSSTTSSLPAARDRAVFEQPPREPDISSHQCAANAAQHPVGRRDIRVVGRGQLAPRRVGSCA